MNNDVSSDENDAEAEVDADDHLDVKAGDHGAETTKTLRESVSPNELPSNNAHAFRAPRQEIIDAGVYDIVPTMYVTPNLLHLGFLLMPALLDPERRLTVRLSMPSALHPTYIGCFLEDPTVISANSIG